MKWFDCFFNHIYMGIGPGKKTQKRLAEYANNLTFQNVFQRLMSQAVTMYSGIDGLDPTMDKKTIIQSLIAYGGFGVFEKFGSNLSLPGTPTNGVTLYGYFNAMYVYGKNGFNEEVPVHIPGGNDNKLIQEPRDRVLTAGSPRGVWIRDNPETYPFINYVIDYAAKITECYRALDIIRENLKTPYIITAEEELVNTIKRMFEKVDNFESRIVSTGILPADRINALELPTPPDGIKSVTELTEWYFSDFNKLTGMKTNSNPDKAERLNLDETNAANDATDKIYKAHMDFIQAEFDFCNEKMNTRLTIKPPEGETRNDALQPMDTDAGPGKMANSGSSDNQNK